MSLDGTHQSLSHITAQPWPEHKIPLGINLHVTWCTYRNCTFRHRHGFASKGRTAAVHKGSVHRPLTTIPLDHIMIDELHLLLRVFDILLRNVITISEPHTQQLVACIRSCGVSFNVWESESSDGKVEWTSLTGEAKKKVLKVQQ